jgi:hypothetical protein
MKIQFTATFSFLLLIAASCNKSPLDHPEYIGDWSVETVNGPQYVNINEDGTGSFYFDEGGTVNGSGKVRISESHLKIGNSHFDIIEPPTQIDTVNEFGHLVSWEMNLHYKAIFTSGEDMHLYRK